jgi:hypothetical protein
VAHIQKIGTFSIHQKIVEQPLPGMLMGKRGPP